MIEEKMDKLILAIGALQVSIEVLTETLAGGLPEAANTPNRIEDDSDPTKKIAKAKPGRKSKAETPAPQKAPATPEPPPQPVWTYDQVQNKAVDVSRILGPNFDRMAKIMSDHGISRLPDIKPEQFASFMESLASLEMEFKK